MIYLCSVGALREIMRDLRDTFHSSAPRASADAVHEARHANEEDHLWRLPRAQRAQSRNRRLPLCSIGPETCGRGWCGRMVV